MIKRNGPRPTQKIQHNLSKPGQITITRPSFIPGPMSVQNKLNMEEQKQPTVVEQYIIPEDKKQSNAENKMEHNLKNSKKGIWSQNSEMVAQRFIQSKLYNKQLKEVNLMGHHHMNEKKKNLIRIKNKYHHSSSSSLSTDDEGNNISSYKQRKKKPRYSTIYNL